MPYPYSSENEAYRYILSDICRMGDARHREKVAAYYEVLREEVRLHNKALGEQKKSVSIKVSTICTSCRVQESLRLGFLGNQPLSTRFFCSKSSPIPHRAEAPNTPTTAETMAFSMNKAATIAATPTTRYNTQGRVPQ